MVALPKPDNRILDTIIQGDCLEVLRSLADNSVDACVVDPPYGLGEVKDIAGLLQAWIRDEDDSRYLGKSGFMGKEWDAGVPGPRYWREVLRVMKPGAHILCFASTRTVDLMMIALRLAGFQCRDTLMWVYGQGFPKNTDISRKIDKMRGVKRETVGYGLHVARRHSQPFGQGAIQDVSRDTRAITAPATPEACQHAGTGTALKPAHEPIILARKPLSEKSIAANVLKWGTGGLAIDACRIRSTGNEPNARQHKTIHGTTCEDDIYAGGWKGTGNGWNGTQGRFPSNLLLSHSLFCVPLGTRKVKGNGNLKPWHKANGIPSNSLSGGKDGSLNSMHGHDYNDEDGMEEVQAWECTEDCPIRLLDEQSGIRKSKAAPRGGTSPNPMSWGNPRADGDKMAGYTDQGGASRYFTQFCYTAKTSRRERNLGLDAMPEQASSRYGRMNGTPEHAAKHDTPEQNTHPTVKPLALMSWLCRLITPPGGIVLDPFFGSGSTGVACVHEGLHFIGIEAEADYCAIARARLAHVMSSGVMSDY